MAQEIVRIWEVVRLDTKRISELAHVAECDVERIINRHLDARYAAKLRIKQANSAAVRSGENP